MSNINENSLEQEEVGFYIDSVCEKYDDLCLYVIFFFILCLQITSSLSMLQENIAIVHQDVSKIKADTTLPYFLAWAQFIKQGQEAFSNNK